MTHKTWLTRSLDDMPRKEDEKKELVRFWNEFYTYLLLNTNKSEQQGKTNSVKYKDTVFDILENAVEILHFHHFLPILLRGSCHFDHTFHPHKVLDCHSRLFFIAYTL